MVSLAAAHDSEWPTNQSLSAASAAGYHSALMGVAELHHCYWAAQFPYRLVVHLVEYYRLVSKAALMQDGHCRALPK